MTEETLKKANELAAKIERCTNAIDLIDSLDQGNIGFCIKITGKETIGDRYPVIEIMAKTAAYNDGQDEKPIADGLIHPDDVQGVLEKAAQDLYSILKRNRKNLINELEEL
jgi:hypothetical protein